MINAFVKGLMFDILAWKTNLSDGAVHEIVDVFAKRASNCRHTFVPTYLTDDMYEAVRSLHPGVDFATANSIYVRAVDAYKNKDMLCPPAEESGSFW